MDDSFVRKLDDLRERLGFPLIINSGYRCPDHNERVSNTGRNGPHTTGHAADVKVYGRQAFELVTHCTLGGWMRGIGLRMHGNHARRFVHLDDLDSSSGRFRPTIWTYKD